MTTFIEIESWAQELVQSKRLANAEITIYRHGETHQLKRFGTMDLEGQRPLPENTIFRIYSMTKPIIAAAIMMLREEGKLDLNDPASKFIPEFENTQVVRFENGKDVGRESAERNVTVHDLLTHTAGLTYGGPDYPPVSTGYKNAGVDFAAAYANLDEMVANVAGCPLYYQPGSRWIYSIANDILGRIIEVASEMTLDQFLQNRIFAPLGMVDTGFHVGPEKQSRFPSNFGYDQNKNLIDTSDGSNDRFLKSGTLLSGGGGLVSTSSDYMKFARMLLNKGSLDDVTILQPASVDLMTQNQLPGDIPSMGCPEHSTMDMTGIGYGYGVAVIVDEQRASISCSNGDFGWGGVANTYFWVDPKQDMIVLFMSQLMPASDMPIRVKLRDLVYQSIIDA